MINSSYNYANSKRNFIYENNSIKMKNTKENNISEVKNLKAMTITIIALCYIIIGHFFIINSINMQKKKSFFILIIYFLIELPLLIIQIYFNLIVLIIYTIKDGLSSFIHRFYYSIKNKKYDSYKILAKLFLINK